MTHVEHEHVADRREGAGLDEETDSLLDRHEVARRLGMRDGHWAAAIDLPREDRNSAADGAKDVAEPDHGVILPVTAGICDRQKLAEPLRVTQDARGLDGLVGRNEYKPCDALSCPCFEHVRCTKDIRRNPR